MHMYGISNSLATFLPNLALLCPVIHEILSKVRQSTKNPKMVTL